MTMEILWTNMAMARIAPDRWWRRRQRHWHYWCFGMYGRMACQFLSPFGFGMTADAIQCIDYSRQQGAHIMSNSWGGGGFSQALYDAISRARDEDILFTAAAGNSGSEQRCLSSLSIQL